DQCEVVLRHAEEGGHLAARGPLALQAMAAGDKTRMRIQPNVYAPAGDLSRVLCRHASSLDLDRACPRPGPSACVARLRRNCPVRKRNIATLLRNLQLPQCDTSAGVARAPRLSLTGSVEPPPYARIRPSGLNCLIWLWR